jgi:hypothetical protein
MTIGRYDTIRRSQIRKANKDVAELLGKTSSTIFLPFPPHMGHGKPAIYSSKYERAVLEAALVNEPLQEARYAVMIAD